MSIAWTTLIVITFLLPGIFFLIGSYSKDRVSRDVAWAAPLFSMGLSIACALFIHGIYYYFDSKVCGGWLPCVRIDYVLALLEYTHGSSVPLEKIANDISEYRGYIILYFIFTSSLGFLLGWFYSYLISRGVVSGFNQHKWARDLAYQDENSITWAYVLTRIQVGNRILMYKGAVKEFYVNSDGSLSYLVMVEGVRYYMYLKKNTPIPSNVSNSPSIGAKVGDRYFGDGEVMWSNLLIEGQDISNVLFERRRLPDFSSKFTTDEFEEMVENIRREEGG